MLVYVHSPFAGTFLKMKKVKNGLGKHHFEEKMEYCITAEDFICDEKDVQKEIIRHAEEHVRNNKTFEGYSFEIPAGRYPDSIRYANGYRFEPTVTYVKELKMSKILELLTGEQFMQFCKETKQSVEESVKCENLG